MGRSEKKLYIRTLFWFLGFNILLSIGINYTYLVFTPIWNNLLSIVFLHSALVSNILLIYLLISLPLLILGFGSRYRIPIVVLPVVVLSSLHIFNLIDIAIYRIFKFHFNSMVINLIFTEGAEDSLYFGLNTLAVVGLIIIGILAAEALLFHKVYHRYGNKPISKPIVIAVVTISLLIVSADKLTFAIADLYNRNEVTRYNKVLPLYQPLTIKRFMRKQLGFKVDREEILTLEQSNSNLNYPKRALSSPRQTYPVNIVWIVIDSWRYDMLSEELTPNIWNFSKRSTIFMNHYSGGNASRFGIFSLFYGIYGYYWHQFLGERQSPVFIDQLKKLNYDFKIVSSSKLTNPEFRKTAFIKIPENIVDKLNGNRAENKDPLLTTTFLSWLDTRNTDKPFFSFLFYDAPHGPYSYPDEFKKYTPSNKQPNYITVGKKDSLSLLNSYKNAIHFDDSEVGEIITALEKKELLDNTIIIITGDHGEEFYETGYWGHISAFNKYQTKVPLLLYVPNQNSNKIKYLTSHVDVVPTMLELLGYSDDEHIYTQGNSLLGSRRHEYIVASGWDDCAIIYPKHTLVFSFESYNLGSWDVYDSQYRPINNGHNILIQKRPDILNVMKGFKEYLK